LLILISLLALSKVAAVLVINQPGVWQVGLKLGEGVKGITTQLTRLKIIIANGAMRKTTVLDLLGMTISLHRSFNPSAKGWRSPKRPTILGPRRR
jgi:hypothetical protein